LPAFPHSPLGSAGELEPHGDDRMIAAACFELDGVKGAIVRVVGWLLRWTGDCVLGGGERVV
jgi:hypothetical protein